MTPKQYWLDIKYLDKHIDSKLEQIERLQSQAERSTTTLSDMPRTKSQSNRSDYFVLKIIELKDELDKDVDVYVDRIREAQDLLRRLEVDKHRLVLEYRYLNKWTWAQIANEMTYDVRHITRLHGQALYEFGQKCKDVLLCPKNL